MVDDRSQQQPCFVGLVLLVIDENKIVGWGVERVKVHDCEEDQKKDHSAVEADIDHKIKEGFRHKQENCLLDDLVGVR